MKKGFSEMVFILDRSGSMGGLESDTIGGFNSMLREQQAVDGDAIMTIVLLLYWIIHVYVSPKLGVYSYVYWSMTRDKLIAA